MRRVPRRIAHGEAITLVEHLEELRWRLAIMLAALALGSVLAFAFHAHILDWLDQPLPADRRHVVTFGVSEPFTTSITVSVYAGFLVALPAILWQLWSFFAPAIHPSVERRALGLAAFAALLGAVGLAFGYWILLPRAIRWLTSYDQAQFHILVRASDYYTFVSTVLLGIVCIFELPMIVLGLVHLGALSARRLRRSRRLGYFLTAVIALGLPGPDPMTTALELLPMWILFESSIWLAVLTERRQRRRATATPATATHRP